MAQAWEQRRLVSCARCRWFSCQGRGGLVECFSWHPITRREEGERLTSRRVSTLPVVVSRFAAAVHQTASSSDVNRGARVVTLLRFSDTHNEEAFLGSGSAGRGRRLSPGGVFLTHLDSGLRLQVSYVGQ